MFSTVESRRMGEAGSDMEGLIMESLEPLNFY